MEVDQSVELNQEQRSAVEVRGGPLRIMAAAGTGKTSVIVERFVHLVREAGIHPGRILVLTFSRQAAGELRQRIATRLQPRSDLAIRTFHSYCLRVLRRLAGDQPLPRLIGDQERYHMLRELYAGRQWEYYIGDSVTALVDDLTTLLNRVRDELILPEEYQRYAAASGHPRLRDLAAAYQLYLDRLRQRQLYEFSDLVPEVIRLWREEPGLLADEQARYDHIMVDEFQDTNTAQYELVKLLAAGHRNLCVVGDDDQAIYRFRGATDRYIKSFPDDFAPSAEATLELNYRSPACVLGLANGLIARNRHRVAKQLRAGANLSGVVEYHTVATEEDEARLVAAKVAALACSGQATYSDIAILLRSTSQSAPAIGRALAELGIPYSIVGGGLIDDPALGDIRAYLELACDLTGPGSDRALLRLLARRVRGTLLLVLEEEAAASGRSLADQLATGTDAGTPDQLPAELAEAYRALMDQVKRLAGIPGLAARVWQAQVVSGYLVARDEYNATELHRVRSLRALLARAVEAEQAGLDHSAFLAGLADFGLDTEEGGGVRIMTMHAAKGLQFPVVILPNLAEGRTPARMRLEHLFDIEDLLYWQEHGRLPDSDHLRAERFLEEERRLFYVALTRAQQRLILTRARLYDGILHEPSPFLRELGELPPQGEQPETGYRLRAALREELVDALLGRGYETAPRVVGHSLALAELHARIADRVPVRRPERASPYDAQTTLRLSPTALDGYKLCPRRFYLTRILKLPEEGSAQARLGTAFHQAAQMLNSHRMVHGRLPGFHQVAQAFESQLSPDDFHSRRGYQQELALGLAKLRRWYQWEGQQPPREVIAVEHTYQVTVPDLPGVTFTCRVDAVLRHPDGRTEIVDYKSGKPRSNERLEPEKAHLKSHISRRLQSILYYLALTGGRVDPDQLVTYIFLTQKGEELSLAVNDPAVASFTYPEQCFHEMLEEVRQLVAGIRANQFDPKKPFHICGPYCGVKPLCEVYRHEVF